MSKLKLTKPFIDKSTPVCCSSCKNYWDGYYNVRLYLTKALYLDLDLCKKCLNRVRNHVERHNGVLSNEH